MPVVIDSKNSKYNGFLPYLSIKLVYILNVLLTIIGDISVLSLKNSLMNKFYPTLINGKCTRNTEILELNAFLASKLFP